MKNHDTNASLLTNLAVNLSEAVPRGTCTRRSFVRKSVRVGAIAFVTSCFGPFVRKAPAPTPQSPHAQKFDELTTPPSGPCTITPGCGRTSSECGNGGWKCSTSLKSCSEDPACCQCKKDGDGCPSGSTKGGLWQACCLCEEHDDTLLNIFDDKIGRVFFYWDCCGPTPLGDSECPPECFNIGPHLFILWRSGCSL